MGSFILMFVFAFPQSALKRSRNHYRISLGILAEICNTLRIKARAVPGLRSRLGTNLFKVGMRQQAGGSWRRRLLSSDPKKAKSAGGIYAEMVENARMRQPSSRAMVQFSTH